MNTATFIKAFDGWQGDARLYKLSQPLDGYGYVIVSAVNALFGGPETYIFGSNKQGEVVSWTELEGSFKGSRDHERALAQAGYEVEEVEDAKTT